CSLVDGTSPATGPQPAAVAESAAGWMEYAQPEEAGFSLAKLASARQLAEAMGSAAVVAVYRGNVIAAWGAVDRNLMAHSVRKSFVDALFGIAVAEHRVALDATLEG